MNTSISDSSSKSTDGIARVKRGKQFDPGECEAIVRAMILTRYNGTKGSDQKYHDYQREFRSRFDRLVPRIPTILFASRFGQAFERCLASKTNNFSNVKVGRYPQGFPEIPEVLDDCEKCAQKKRRDSFFVG